MKEAVETAIKMETDAITFYTEAAQKTVHPFGKEMFRGFVKDERRHLRMLQELFRGMKVQLEFHRPKDAIKTVFSEQKDAMMERIKALEDELEAIRIAMKMEKDGFDYYKEAAAKAGSPEEKELFERLAVEENDHFAILNETFSFLDNTGQWYMYEERGIVEG
ncbi:MAG: ferritin family protein [Nitrospirae bacterium]|nr:ferritin family protein [Nitrospirota bacterium]